MRQCLKMHLRKVHKVEMPKPKRRKKDKSGKKSTPDDDDDDEEEGAQVEEGTVPPPLPILQELTAARNEGALNLSSSQGHSHPPQDQWVAQGGTNALLQGEFKIVPR